MDFLALLFRTRYGQWSRGKQKIHYDERYQGTGCECDAGLRRWSREVMLLVLASDPTLRRPLCCTDQKHHWIVNKPDRGTSDAPLQSRIHCLCGRSIAAQMQDSTACSGYRATLQNQPRQIVRATYS